MDDLQFRRTIYAEPDCNDESVKEAAAHDPAKQEFWNELKELDANLKQAAKVAVPDGLAHKLILKQSFKQHQKNRHRNRWYMALAASFAIIFGVSFTLWQQLQHVNLAEHALAHIYHEGDEYALKVDGNVSLDEVNAKLVEMGTMLTAQVGRVYFANFCKFDKITSFHMVFQGESGKVTVFLVPPKDSYEVQQSFADERMDGEIIELENAHMVVIGEKGKSFEHLKQNLEKSLIFSA